ncbi:MAG: threonine synthase [Anaerolineae bacterium]|nr:threonine synthase [Anaerolineae bacterium]
MGYILGLRCVLCGEEYNTNQVTYVCPKHGDEGILDVVYDYAAIGRAFSRNDLANKPPNIWRYQTLLPIPDVSIDDTTGALWSVGWTPLYHAERLGRDLGLAHLYVKDDGRNPTASLKDRASAVAVIKAREAGAEVATTASSGNAASALAGMAASTGLPTVIFVPETAPQAKVAQLLIFGARVLLVQGTYDQAFDLCLAASKEYGWYCRNTAYNPYMSEGKKTAAYEICEQLNWRAPDRIFVSVGDGCIIGGLWKGLRDLAALGWIDRMPKLMGVQAAGSAVLVEAWRRGTEEITPIVPQTIADSISVGIPRDRIKALRAVRETGGAYLAVTDEEILDAMRLLARGAGVFAEPAGATAYAGLVQAEHAGQVDSGERVVVLVTGNGLKDVASAIKATGQAQRIAPTMDAVRAAVPKMP